MATFIVESSTDKDPLSSDFSSSPFMIAAFYNSDHHEATFSGIYGSHDTVSILFQDDDNSRVGKSKISSTTTEHGPKTFK